MEDGEPALPLRGLPEPGRGHVVGATGLSDGFFSTGEWGASATARRGLWTVPLPPGPQGGVAVAHLPRGTDARGDGGLPRTPPPPPPSPDGPLRYTLRHLY